jgi:glycolate oxidase FAD binding subunit
MNTVEGEVSADAWAGVRDVSHLHDTAGDIWRLSVKPSDGATVLARLPEGARSCLDWGGGRVWVACDAGHDLRADLAGIGGHATLVRASDATLARLPAFHPEPPAIQRISQGLKARFDPRGILNPGLMG